MTFETRVHVELQFSRSRLCSHHELRDDMKRAAFLADSMMSENKKKNLLRPTNCTVRGK